MDPFEEREVLGWLRATKRRGYLRYLRQHPGQLAPLVMMAFMVVIFLPLLGLVGSPVPADQVDLGAVGFGVGMFLFFLVPLLALVRGGAVLTADMATVSILFAAPVRRGAWVRSNLAAALRDMGVASVLGAGLGAWFLSSVVEAPVALDFVRVLVVLGTSLLLFVSLGVLLAYASARAPVAFERAATLVVVALLGYLVLFLVLFDTPFGSSFLPLQGLVAVTLDVARFLVGLPMTPLQWAPLAVTGGVAGLLAATTLHRQYDLPGAGSNYGSFDRTGLSQERAPPSGLWWRVRLRLRPRYRDLGPGWKAVGSLQLVQTLRGSTFLLPALLLPVLFVVLLFPGGSGAGDFAVFMIVMLSGIIGGMTAAGPGTVSPRETLRLLPIPPAEMMRGLLVGPLVVLLPMGAIALVAGLLSGAALLGLAGLAFLLSLALCAACATLALCANLPVGSLFLAGVGRMLGFVEGIFLLFLIMPLLSSGSSWTPALALLAIAGANLLVAWNWYRLGTRRFDAAPSPQLRPFTTTS